MSADHWPACIAFTLGEEGGLTDDVGDPGGLTNFGISQRAYPDLDIANLTAAQAKAIYRRDYWAPLRGDDLPTGVDLMVFDMGVNAGVRRTAAILQTCLGVAADGAIGPLTLLAARGADDARLIDDLAASQLGFYRSLATWPAFGHGWSGRVARRQTAARAMMATTTGVS